MIIVATGGLLLLVSKGKGDLGGFAFIYFGGALLLTIAAFAGSYYQYSSLVTAERAGQVSVVEGLVTNFKPAPERSHSRERFCVASKCFEYSHNTPMGGFIDIKSQGGPIIKDGLQVRVAFVDNTIVRLEVAD